MRAHSRYACGICACSLAGALVFAATPAVAQDVGEGTQLTPEESAILGNALIFDPATLSERPKKELRLPGQSGKEPEIVRTEKPDGSATFVVKQPLSTEWTNAVGADLAPANSGKSGAFDDPVPGTREEFGKAAAWASVGVPHIGSVDARVDPSNEQGKLGTTLKQSIPFGQRFAVTIQDTYSVTETLGQPSAGPSDLPLMALPPPSTTAPTQVFGNEKAVKFNILPTGTTLGAGLTSASNDPVTHNTFMAQQKVYGPLQVTTAVTDVGQTTSSKSITAGFRLNW